MVFRWFIKHSEATEISNSYSFLPLWLVPVPKSVCDCKTELREGTWTCVWADWLASSSLSPNLSQFLQMAPARRHLTSLSPPDMPELWAVTLISLPLPQSLLSSDLWIYHKFLSKTKKKNTQQRMSMLILFGKFPLLNKWPSQGNALGHIYVYIYSVASLLNKRKVSFK